MPNQPKTPASSFRFSRTELNLMDELGKKLAVPGIGPLTRTGVLRVALHRLSEQTLKINKRK